MRVCLIIVLMIFYMSCTETEITSGFSIESNNNGQSSVDTTPPSLIGSITLAADSSSSSASTATWGLATDSSGIDFYSLSINLDEGNGTCGSEDFSGGLTLSAIKVPSSADFSGAGYQVINAANDGDANPITLTLLGSTDYCIEVTATDKVGNESSPIYSSSVSKYFYHSCKEKLAVEPATLSGVHEIDADGVGGDSEYSAYCDMTTQSGGWTLVIKYDDSLFTAPNYALSADAGRSQINTADLLNLDGATNLTSSHNMIPFVEQGATHLMHVGKADGVSAYVRTYFSEIYQAVIDTPNNLFNSSLDTNDNAGLSGTIVSGTNATLKNRWFESDFSVMTIFESDGGGTNVFRINGGEGDAMFINGDREGALYGTAASSGASGHGNPKVQWGFRGQDSSQQSYGGNIHIGTRCSSGGSCAPESRINLMFIR